MADGTKRPVAVVDLFCGVGGLAHGFVLEEFSVVAGIDSDPSCEYAFVENNNSKFICEKVENLNPQQINSLFPKNALKILVGCAPCQPFSRYTAGISGDEADTKWKLLRNFGEIIKGIQPDIISMENVPQLARYDKKGVYGEFIQILRENDYFISDSKKIVSCPEYGVPQKRKRLVLIASKLGKIDLIAPLYTDKKDYPTVYQAIGKMPKIKDGVAHEDDKLHRAQKLSTLNKQRIIATTEGGSWRDWSDDLKLVCHRKPSGSTFGDMYGRMKWHEPAPTLTTHCTGLGNGRFGHPEQHRAISLREAAVLQSFPIDYKFISPDTNYINYTDLKRHIGNAVPVALGRAIAVTIKEHLEFHQYNINGKEENGEQQRLF